MRRDVKHKGPFTVETKTEENGHEEVYLMFKGKLIHKRWNPKTDRGYSRTFGKYGSTSW